MALMCPSCRNILSTLEIGSVHLDVCIGGCGGMWFDQGELRRLDEPHELVEDWVWSIEINPRLEVDFERRRHCPRCVGTLMLRHYWSIKKKVLIDEGQTCAGYWLDDGELRSIRTLFKSEAERKRAAMSHFSELFDGQLEAQRSISDMQNEKIRSVARMFRHITPSHYLNKKDK